MIQLKCPNYFWPGLKVYFSGGLFQLLDRKMHRKAQKGDNNSKLLGCRPKDAR